MNDLSRDPAGRKVSPSQMACDSYGLLNEYVSTVLHCDGFADGIFSRRRLPVNPLHPLKIRDFADDCEVRALVRAFESATISPAEFRHAAHIAVALSYLAIEPLEPASARMRRSLLNFARCHGLNVYHETMTHFWMKLLDHLAATHYRKVPLWRRVNLIVERWAGTDPISTHYSRRAINSRAARESWVDPDRLPLPF